jgi:hypothetical protein
VRARSSGFCEEIPTVSGHSSMTVSSKMCAFPDKAAAIREILNVWMTWLVSQVWLVGEHLIHNL